ncbi:MAG: hypothetical protein H7320_10105 [Ferruginibacter sp.]|nr:hypothetical protein [Ferruginibacter sp.]
MEENKTGTQNRTDDLDLVSLFERLFSFIKKFGLLIAIFTISGMLVGFGIYKKSSKSYASSMLLHSFMLTNTEQINIIENWNNLLKNKEYAILSERLHCNAEIFKKINKITAVETQKLYIQNNPNGFLVEVTVKDNAVLDSLEKGIVFGLENSDYVKARLSSKRSNLIQLIDKVQTEIIKLDSTKLNIEKRINSNNQQGSSFIIDVSNINTQMIALNEKLLDFREQLKFTNAVQVFHGFEKFQKPVSPKLFKSVVLGFIGGFAIGYIVAIYLYIISRIRLKRK